MTRATRTIQGLAVALACLAGLAASGCAAPDPLGTPRTLSAPQPQVWAVAPLLNESGTSLADPVRMADAVIQEVQQINGIDALPVDRVIVAMRELDLRRISSPYEAQELIRVLGVDGLLVGSITAWDPYRPVVLGLAMELHLRDGPLGGGVDPIAVSRATAGTADIGALGPPAAIASEAAIFDASNQRVLKWVRDYADARHEPERPFGPEIHLVSMDRFARFAAFRLLERLLARERMRLAEV